MLVEPYYNGPSSLEIRKEYIAPIAALYKDLDIIPYVIPGRTGTQLYPPDLALLYKQYPNVRTVKEATGSLRDAYTLLDQVMSFSQIADEGEKGITLSRIRDQLGLTGVEQISRIGAIISHRDKKEVLELTDEILGSGCLFPDLGRIRETILSLVEAHSRHR